MKSKQVQGTTSTVRHQPPAGDIECCHPRCSAAPQQRYEFPIPLCGRHIVQVLARSAEVTSEARRDHVVKNQKPLPLRKQEMLNRGYGEFSHEPIVYYLKFGDRIKIGTTTNLRKRLLDIPHDQVLAVEPGGLAMERRRHLQFRSHRISGEWFTAGDDLMRHIKALQGNDAQGA